jgi:hypothetical protein
LLLLPLPLLALPLAVCCSVADSSRPCRHTNHMTRWLVDVASGGQAQEHAHAVSPGTPTWCCCSCSC